uniref:Amino acid permease/ SLC12A domain-containing protein n=1 Tax=Leptocylindrus danicus TaxID=163516 RepID=A0A7S2NXX5_9STRA|mmetsp:Transcript_16541/g.24427  ORF Transcript_16541/g.24427 Transcript_16541/m.24427 type:complete len:613 (+) Transcript_16541:384-2222(+)
MLIDSNTTTETSDLSSDDTDTHSVGYRYSTFENALQVIMSVGESRAAALPDVVGDGDDGDVVPPALSLRPHRGLYVEESDYSLPVVTDEEVAPSSLGTAVSCGSPSLLAADGGVSVPSLSLVPKLGLWQLTILVFYSVSGGPFGIENAVLYGGAYYSIIGFLVLPILWSFPEALVTAELGSAFPEAGGSVAWVQEAFGPRWGLFGGYLAWVSGATDNAIYPALFLGYLVTSLNSDSDGDADADADGSSTDPEVVSDDEFNMWRFLLLSSISVVLAVLNYRGLDFVGSMSIVISLLSMSPFIIMCFVGMWKVDPSRWFQRPTVETGQLFNVNWRPFLNNLFWNLNSFDSGGNFAGEAMDSHTTYPRAMIVSVFLVFISYFLPLLVALGATESEQSEWKEGYLGVVASKIVGNWLGGWTVFAAAISNLSLFEAEMSADAYQLLGMADRGLIPKIFSVRSKYGTPTNGIILGTVIIVAMCVTDFDALVEMLNFYYCLNLLLEYAAFVKLRISQPDVPRPFKVPLNTFGCCIFVAPPIIVTCVILYLASWLTYIVCLGLIVLGLLLFFFQEQLKNYGSNYCTVHSPFDCEGYVEIGQSAKNNESVNTNAPTMPAER